MGVHTLGRTGHHDQAVGVSSDDGWGHETGLGFLLLHQEKPPLLVGGRDREGLCSALGGFEANHDLLQVGSV